MSDTLERLRTLLADRYAIERELGRGGMGAVFLAEDLKHRRKVAVKVLPAELASSLGAQRFLREIETAARLTHPHIVPLHDSGEAGGYLYYVMPYLQGETLRDRLTREKQLPLDDALAIAREVAQALDYAHRQGVVHRDIKPENIMLEEGHALVADFGISRAVTAAGGGSLTRTGVVVGTPVYMSPEQASGEPALDGRSDVYALGCVLFEMLAGRPPFVGPTVESVVHQHLAVDAPPVRDLRPAVPPALVSVLARALAKSPADRYRTAGDLAADLRDAETRPPAGDAAAPLKRTLLAIGSVAVVVVAVIWWVVTVRSVEGTPRFRSIAVLPLDNHTPDASQDYFVDGMTEALIADLAQIRALKVISRTSVMRYKGVEKPLPEIARELGVDAIVEGSVFRVDNKVRITAQLIDGATDEHLWADSYERELKDILALQMEVARAIANEIRIVLSPAERVRLATGRQVSPEAYEAYLRGRFYWNKRTREGFEAAIREFRRAIEIDPTYAAAYSGLADCYILLVEWRFLPPVEGVPLARAAADEALKLDSTVAEAYTSLGEVRQIEWDWAAAERAYRRATELNPGYATGHQWFGYFLSKMGRHDEAIAQLQRAEELDPLSLIIKTEFGRVYYHAGRYDDAIRVAQRALDLDSSFVDAHWVIGHVYEQLGRYDEAIAAFRKTAPAYPIPFELAHTLAVAGRRAEARRVIDSTLAAARANGLYVSLAPLAEVYVALGEHDRAYELLERAYANGVDDGLTYLKVRPTLDPLREEPRFRSLLEHLRFPQ